MANYARMGEYFSKIMAMLEGLVMDVFAEHLLRGRFDFAVLDLAEIRKTLRIEIDRGFNGGWRSNDSEELELRLLTVAALLHACCLFDQVAGNAAAKELIIARFGRRDGERLYQMVFSGHRRYAWKKQDKGEGLRFQLLFFHHFAWYMGQLDNAVTAVNFFKPQDQASALLNWRTFIRDQAEMGVSALVFRDDAAAPSRAAQLETMTQELTEAACRLLVLRNHRRTMQSATAAN